LSGRTAADDDKIILLHCKSFPSFDTD
jgi:hypothetical protein